MWTSVWAVLARMQANATRVHLQPEGARTRSPRHFIWFHSSTLITEQCLLLNVQPHSVISITRPFSRAGPRGPINHCRALRTGTTQTHSLFPVNSTFCQLTDCTIRRPADFDLYNQLRTLMGFSLIPPICYSNLHANWFMETRLQRGNIYMHW